MRPIISDSSPIITFSRANRLSLLKSMLQEIIIPGAVHHEIVEQGRGKSGWKPGQEE